jgi:hypothetical protein
MQSEDVLKLGIAGQYVTPHFFGSVSVFLTCIPYALATALQYQGIEIALIAGTAASGALALCRILLFSSHLCQVRDLLNAANRPFFHAKDLFFITSHRFLYKYLIPFFLLPWQYSLEFHFHIGVT